MKNLKSGGEPLTPKKWQADISTLTAKKDLGYKEMRDMREQLKAIETLKKAAEKLEKEQPSQSRKKEDHEL